MPHPIVCFIDDSPFERRLFERFFPPAAPNWRFVIADGFEAAKREIGEKTCLLFLLDLYGQDPENPIEPTILMPGEIKPPARPFKDVWEGLDELGEAIKVNEYLKRLHTYTGHWGRAFIKAAEKAGQSRAYGLYNLARVIEEFPWAAAVAYSRKAGSADLVAFMAAGGDGALMKPQGEDDRAIAQATETQAPEIIAYLGELVAARSADVLLRLSLGLKAGQALFLQDLARAILFGSDPPDGWPGPEGRVSRYVEAVIAWLAGGTQSLLRSMRSGGG